MWIKHRTHHTHVSYNLCFDYVGERNWGFSFNCDENGKMDLEKLNPAAQENYQKCLDGTHKVQEPVVRRQVNTYFEPGEIKCVCGAHVVLHGFTNTCDACERDYNGSGQLLADRSQWGEETGEDWSECY